MTTDSELTRSLRAFLEEGADRMPDRVFQGAMDVVPATRRRRSWTSPLEMRPVASLLRVAAVAAFVVVAIGGVSLLPGLGGVGVFSTPTPTATPTPAPSLAPTPSPTLTGGPLAGVAFDTILGAGTYEIGSPFAVPFSISLPADTRFGRIEAGNASFATPDGTLEAFVPDAVFPDPCHITGEPVAVDTPDELLAALRSMEGFTATEPTQTTVAGHPAKAFVLTNTIDTATAGCTQHLMLPLFTYLAHPEGAGTNGGQRQVVWVVDVDGRPLLVLGDGWDDSARATLEALVGSIELP